MALPQNDPANTGPGPIYQDNDFVRGGQLRANNQAVWENLEYLDGESHAQISNLVTSTDKIMTYRSGVYGWSDIIEFVPPGMTWDGAGVTLFTNNVGIGSISTFKLEVAGATRIQYDSSNAYLNIKNIGTGGRSWNFMVSANGNGVADDGFLTIRDDTAGKNRIIVDPDGDVGIGVGSSGGLGRLNIETTGSGGATQFYLTNSIDNNSGLIQFIGSTFSTAARREFLEIHSSSGGISLWTGGSQNVTVTSSGDVKTVGGIDAGNNGTFLKTKVVEIGVWDMNFTIGDGSINKVVAHGLGASYMKIRSISVFIRNDDNDTIKEMGRGGDGASAIRGKVFDIDGTNVELLQATTNSTFDHIDYNTDTGFNRGWIYITYEA